VLPTGRPKVSDGEASTLLESIGEKMRKIGILLIVVAISAVSGALAQEKWSSNAQRWKQLSPEIRTMYIYGFTTGVSYERLAAKYPNDLKLEFPDSTTPQDITTALDAFYAKPENALVCWTDAIDIAVSAMGGSPKSEQNINLVRKTDGKNGCNY
jgi:hypothetical protein